MSDEKKPKKREEKAQGEKPRARGDRRPGPGREGDRARGGFGGPRPDDTRDPRPRREGGGGPPGGGAREDRGGPGARRPAGRDDRPRQGGFGGPRDDRRPPREGGFGPPRPQGGFGGGRDDRRPPRDGGFGGPRDDRRPPREGGFSGGRDDRSGRPGEDRRPPRDGGFGPPREGIEKRFRTEPPTLSRPKIRRIVDQQKAPRAPEEGPPTERKNKFDALAAEAASDSEPLTPRPEDLPRPAPSVASGSVPDLAPAEQSAPRLDTPPPPSLPTDVAALVESTLENAALRVPELRAVRPSSPPSRPALEPIVPRPRPSTPAAPDVSTSAPHLAPHAPTHTHAAGHAHDHAHAHDHDHGHDHAPAHATGHAHGHAHVSDRKLHRDELALGSGRGKVLFLDAPAGLAGDMIVGALVDLGVPESIVPDAIGKLGLAGFHVHFGGREQSGIVATTFDVHVDGPQPERTFRAVRALLLESELPPKVKDRALLVFERLGRAEAKVHRMPIDDVHFHEVGAVDALCDVVGAAAALEYLGAELVVSPLPMGRGFVRARHGVLPLPAPATVECLAGLPTYDAGIDRELVTPTGAAIVGANAARASRWPDLRIERVGFGVGTQSLPDRPNLLRAVLGPVSEEHGASPGHAVATHSVLECNLDDATGELVGYCIETVLREGALDAWAIPSTTKKGRPGIVLACLVPIPLADRLTAALLRESTTIGVRRHDVSRVVRPRKEVIVQTSYGPISVKTSEGPFGSPQQKPEFDDCVRAATLHRVPVREVLAAALEAARARPEAG